MDILYQGEKSMVCPNCGFEAMEGETVCLVCRHSLSEKVPVNNSLNAVEKGVESIENDTEQEKKIKRLMEFFEIDRSTAERLLNGELDSMLAKIYQKKIQEVSPEYFVSTMSELGIAKKAADALMYDSNKSAGAGFGFSLIALLISFFMSGSIKIWLLTIFGIPALVFGIIGLRKAFKGCGKMILAWLALIFIGGACVFTFIGLFNA